MTSFSEIYAALRRKNRRQYALLAGCSFFSVLLITAYVVMMRAPTILSVLPEGGDSRKQVMMVFVLAVLGCGVFTTYAAGLFFRQKSWETGVFLALGATRRQLKRELNRELAAISLGSCAAGAVLGAPLAWGIWQIFRLCVVDTQEMQLRFDPQAYLLSLAFSAFVVLMLFFLGGRAIRRTNIIDIVQESHKSEPIRAVPRWYGPLGLGLIIAGGLLGYMMPTFFITKLHWYPPAVLDGILYLPALVGLYMVLLHTVVNGWSGKKHRYKDLISTSMMQFQGRQTVRNMLVMTVLIAGAYFASFYSPMMGVGAAHGYDARPVDYAYHWRADQDLPGKEEVMSLAGEYGVSVSSWVQKPTALLGVDGMLHIEEEGALGVTWRQEYVPLLAEGQFLSESAYRALSGQDVDILPGQVTGVFFEEEGGAGMFGGAATRITNMVTGQVLQVTPTEEKLAYDMLFGYYVLDDADYMAITEGLTPDWQEELVFFNVEDASETYDFAKALFHTIVERSGPEVEQWDGWDQVGKALAEAAGEPYSRDPENLSAIGYTPIDYDQLDSSDFRLNWKYMPQFRVLDKADFVKTVAVYLMLFIFIAIVCFAAVIVIAFTRSMTIALTNAPVYDDLRHLGAPGAYLYHSARSQVKRVFLVPTVVGTALIYAFYTLIMYFNGDPNAITSSEAAGMLVCLVVVAAISALLYGIYRLTLRQVCTVLRVRRPPRSAR